MQAVIAIILIIVAICVIIKYRVFFITAAILGLIAFIAVKYYKKKKAASVYNPELNPAPELPDHSTKTHTLKPIPTANLPEQPIMAPPPKSTTTAELPEQPTIVQVQKPAPVAQIPKKTEGETNMIVCDTDRPYRQFTMPAELHKAVNMLRGIVAGISSSDGVSSAEIQELVHWCSIHAHMRDRHPFSELLPTIERAVEDGKIDEEEKRDILWLCGNFADSSSFYNDVTSSIQFLNGLVHGIMADGQLSDGEIQTLKLWLDTNDFLQGTYPFDELSSMVHTVLGDKVITEDERNSLMAFMSNFVEFKDSYNLVEADFADLRKKYSIGGVCAFCPDVSIEGKLFCFTGESYRSTRAEIKAEVERLGGSFRTGVSQKTDYLVVGNAGNPCWAYSCYGRKIEEAMALRKEGAKVQIINETDFWDAVWDRDL